MAGKGERRETSMNDEILQLNGLSTETLVDLSYKSQLGKSLRNKLKSFDKEKLIEELFSMRAWLNEIPILDEVDLDYRIKSKESIAGKYERYVNTTREAAQVFNDVLGFRGFCDDYKQVLELQHEEFRVVDMSKGKTHDDGYRGVHLYFELDNYHYPIEIQFNTLYDRQINNWLHDYLYKKDYPDSVGQQMRLNYENGKIRSVEEFEEVLKDVLSGSKR